MGISTQRNIFNPRIGEDRQLVYLSRLRRDSVGADFQSVRKLTNYVCTKPLESRLSGFRNICKARKRYPRCGGCGY